MADIKYIVIYPMTPGGAQTREVTASLEYAREIARGLMRRRKELLHFNVRIEDTDGNLIEYGDGTR
jgi:hypothetical protein